MIKVTRLNKQHVLINSDLIKYVETSPDTLLTLVGGDKIVVLETPERVLELVVEFRRLVLAGLVPPGTAPTAAGLPSTDRPARDS